MWKIYEENNSDLNFALACIYCQAISINEFKKWVDIVISSISLNEIPDYMFDLCDFDQPLFHITNVIGFSPSNDLSKKDELSVYGIAFLRGVDVYDPPAPKSKAIQSLKESPEIYKRFRKFFPFIEIPEL